MVIITLIIITFLSPVEATLFTLMIHYAFIYRLMLFTPFTHTPLRHSRGHATRHSHAAPPSISDGHTLFSPSPLFTIILPHWSSRHSHRHQPPPATRHHGITVTQPRFLPHQPRHRHRSPSPSRSRAAPCHARGGGFRHSIALCAAA